MAVAIGAASSVSGLDAVAVGMVATAGADATVVDMVVAGLVVKPIAVLGEIVAVEMGREMVTAGLVVDVAVTAGVATRIDVVSFELDADAPV